MQSSLIMTLLLLLVASPVWATQNCATSGLGWHFYCDPAKRVTEASKESTLSPAERLEKIQAKLEALKVSAVMEPTEANLKAYVAFQQAQLERASTFSDAWKRMLWRTPELDYNLTKPTSSAGNFVWLDQESNKKNEVLASIGEQYGIFFFYSGRCPYCHQYSPIILNFATEYSITVMPISMDGALLPEWPATIRDSGQYNKLGLQGQPVPATVLFDQKDGRLIPIGFGLLTRSELEERIVKIVLQENPHE